MHLVSIPTVGPWRCSFEEAQWACEGMFGCGAVTWAGLGAEDDGLTYEGNLEPARDDIGRGT